MNDAEFLERMELKTLTRNTRVTVLGRHLMRLHRLSRRPTAYGALRSKHLYNISRSELCVWLQRIRDEVVDAVTRRLKS